MVAPAPQFSMPAFTKVMPVCRLGLVGQLNVKVPVPSLVKPPVVFIVAPFTVRVVPATALILIFETVPVVNVMFLSVELVPPEYLNSPPPKTKLAAALVAFPKFPATSPFPMVPTLSVPALMVTPPVKVFTPDNVNVPVPVLVKDPVLLMMPETVALPVPPNIADVVRVMRPDEVEAVTLLFTKEPLMVKGSADATPFKSTEAPDAMMVMPVTAVVVPRPAAFPNLRVPSLIVVMLLNVLTPLNVHVPVPVFFSVPVLLIIPDAVAFPVPPKMAAVVRVIVPDAVAAVLLLFTSKPLLVKGSADAKPFKSTVAPDAMLVMPVPAVVLPRPAAFPNLIIPAFTYITPIKVFAPLNVQVPVPILLGVPELMTPVAITSPVPPMVETPKEEDRMMAPDAITAVVLLFNKDPWTVNGSAVANPFKSTVAPNKMLVAAVVPKAALLPIFKAPTLTVVAPL